MSTNKLKERLGINELSPQNKHLWKAILAETLGNVLLNFFGCASVINVENVNAPPNLVLIALSFGLAVFSVVHTLGHVSGAHINPAITAGMLITGHINVIKGILYIIGQCVGAIIGSALLKIITPPDVQSKLGSTGLDYLVSPSQGFGMEFLLGFILVLVVYGVCDKNRPESKFTGPLAIGLTVTLGHLAAVDYTGASMNPARSLGSAVFSGEWENHWVFWVGPILGGIVAALLYTHIFAAEPANVIITEKYTAVHSDEKENRKIVDDNSAANKTKYNLKQLEETKNDVSLP